MTPRIPAPARIIEALQALDATETGASIATIADQLVLTEAERFRGVTGRKRSAARARAARAIKRAHWLIETGYRFIAMREIYEISRHD